MFLKGKWKVWVMILTLCVIYSVTTKAIGKVIEDKKEKEPIQYTITMKTENQLLNSRITNKEMTIGKQPYLFKNTETDPDIVITESTSETKFSGYDKLSGYLYTSFTMFTSGSLYNGNEKWLSSVKENDRDKYLIDIRILLDAIESDKTWRDLGITESEILNNVDEKVNLNIPNKYHYSYPYLRLYIAMALNDYKPIEEIKQEDLLRRADIILSKSQKCEPMSFIRNSEKKGMLLAPESTIAECGQEFFNSSAGVIYPGKTLKIKYDAYVKPDVSEVFKDLSVMDKFINLFGLRSLTGNNLSSRDNYFRRCFGVIDTIDLESIKDWQRMMTISTGVSYETSVLEQSMRPEISKTNESTEPLSETVESSEERSANKTETDEYSQSDKQESEKQKELQNSEDKEGFRRKYILNGIFIMMIILLLAAFIFIFYVY